MTYTYERICETCGAPVITGNRHRVAGCNGFVIVKKVKPVKL
jgi:hypothetical protein